MFILGSELAYTVDFKICSSLGLPSVGKYQLELAT